MIFRIFSNHFGSSSDQSSAIAGLDDPCKAIVNHLVPGWLAGLRGQVGEPGQCGRGLSGGLVQQL